METFYSVLGVGRDADEQTIVRAYRDEAKSHHPDVSDRQDATETFKRLTTAKEVLLDETERARYDRLGHESYIERAGECCGWTVDTEPSSGRDGRTERTSTAAGASASRAASEYVSGSEAERSSANDETPRRNQTRTGREETATSYYQPGQRMNPDAAESASGSVLSRFQSVGAWLVLDVLLLVSAVSTSWLILTWGSLSTVSILVAAALCVGVLAATSLHLSARAYA